MTRLVVDASVTLKWVFPDGTEELEDAALALLRRVGAGEITLIQPPPLAGGGHCRPGPQAPGALQTSATGRSPSPDPRHPPETRRA